MAVSMYGEIPFYDGNGKGDTSYDRNETETETGTELSIYINIRDFGLSTRIRLFVHVIFYVCLSVYFLYIWSLL